MHENPKIRTALYKMQQLQIKYPLFLYFGQYDFSGCFQSFSLSFSFLNYFFLCSFFVCKSYLFKGKAF